MWTHTQDVKPHCKQHCSFLIQTLYIKTAENFVAYILSPEHSNCLVFVTAQSVTLFSRDTTKGQFWGSLTEKLYLFIIRALKTEGLQERIVSPKTSKPTDILLPKADLGR